MSPCTYSREPEGIYRLDLTGRMLICPPLIVLGRRPDPERPTSRLVTLAWTDHAETGTWYEAEVPSTVLADMESIGPILARSGWTPSDDAWFDYLCTAVLENFANSLEELAPCEAAAVGV